MRRLEAAVELIKFQAALKRHKPDDDRSKRMIEALDIAIDDIGYVAIEKDPLGLVAELLEQASKRNEKKEPKNDPDPTKN